MFYFNVVKSFIVNSSTSLDGHEAKRWPGLSSPRPGRWGGGGEGADLSSWCRRRLRGRRRGGGQGGGGGRKTKRRRDSGGVEPGRDPVG